MPTAGEDIFTTMAELTADKGGAANKVLYPLILRQDIQDLCRDRLRFGMDDERMSTVFKTCPALFGPLAIAGSDAGPDKCSSPKALSNQGAFQDSGAYFPTRLPT
jgi:hypothetical protein